MDYKKTYQETYPLILSEDLSIAGGGVVFDSEYIVTCAHVVNSALRLPIDSAANQTGKKIRIRFPFNNNLAEQAESYQAEVVGWYPDKTAFTLKKDLAILKIGDPLVISALRDSAGDIEFVADEHIPADEFKMILFDNSAADGISLEVFGRVGAYVKEEGKTMLYSDDMKTSKFLTANLSGCPVYSPKLNGIIGITQTLKKFYPAGQPRTALMIDIRNIAGLISAIEVRSKGFAYYGEEKNALWMQYQRKNSKNMCDRREMVDYIRQTISGKNKGRKLPCVRTNYLKQEDIDDIFIRYKSEFLDPEIHRDVFTHIIRIPDISDLTLFKSAVIYDFNESLSYEYYAQDNSENCSVTTALALNKKLSQRPLFFMIDCDLEKLVPGHIACLKWLADQFLSAFASPPANFAGHFLFIGRHISGNMESKSDIVKKGFGIPELTELRDVPLADVHKWIFRFVPENLRARLRLKFEEENYPMRKIFEHYDEVNKVNLI